MSSENGDALEGSGRRSRTELRASKAAEKFVPWEPYKAAVASAPGQPSAKAPEATQKIAYKVGAVTRKTSKAASSVASTPPLSPGPEGQPSGEAPPCPTSGRVPLLDSYQLPPSPQHLAGPSGRNERDEEKLARKYQELRLAFERLSVERESLSDQLSVQSNVNAELKRLVVASMGEDLGTKLDCMTHNKAHLAQSIVQYSRDLSSGAEEVERVGIQAELWRTKYLAASVMVDELVSWRLFLIRKLEESQAAILRLLQEQEASHASIRLALLLLSDVRGALQPLGSPDGLAKPRSAMSLAEGVAELVGLADAVHAKLLDRGKEAAPSLADLPVEERTFAPTSAAEWALGLAGEDAGAFLASSPCQAPPQREERQRRLAALSAARDPSLTLNCCAHCHGEIHVV